MDWTVLSMIVAVVVVGLMTALFYLGDSHKRTQAIFDNADVTVAKMLAKRQSTNPPPQQVEEVDMDDVEVVAGTRSSLPPVPEKGLPALNLPPIGRKKR